MSLSKAGRSLKASFIAISLASLIASGSACSSPTSRACSEVDPVLRPNSDSVKLVGTYTDRGAEIPQAIARQFFGDMARAAQDMLKISQREVGEISQREVGEISQMAEHFAIALSTEPGTDTGDDEGTAAYMMLRSIGDLP